jgi:DNA-binding transcriptional LysR family regulator
MNARQIEIFRTIMREGTLTAAAHALQISQPAVSKAIRQFEAQIGYLLFERIGGRLLPTAEATLLYGDADKIFRGIEYFSELAQSLKDRRGAFLRIGVSLSAMFTVMPEAVSAFYHRYPDATLHIRTLPKKEIEEQLLLGGLDLGVTMSTIKAPAIRSEVLATSSIVAIMPADDQLARLNAVSPSDLLDRRLISFGSQSDLGPSLDEAFRQIGAVRPQEIQVASSLVAAPLVQVGLGIALIDGFIPWSQFEGIVARPFLPTILMNFAISSNSSKPISRFLQDIKQEIQTAITSSKKKINNNSGWTVIEQLMI